MKSHIGWENIFVCTSAYLYRLYIWLYICEFLNIKGVFLDLPFQGSHKLAVCTDLVVCSVTSARFTAHSVCFCTDLVVCSVTSAMFTAHSVCSSAAISFLFFFLFLNWFPQQTQPAYSIFLRDTCTNFFLKQEKNRNIPSTSKYFNIYVHNQRR